ncbi:hypothetical protein HPB49_011823 [Dermacentor silvarum]|uniref:Uncharacterized protein n=1 Tax=Dermacentor silvarum TaxID=543639 RepID=A0ACB8C3C8_DERSI|nr:hypothetical protein HPB49_011823 [Dermacentor silvarum]
MLNLLLSPEQNLIVASTWEAQSADQLLGDFELQTDKGKMAAYDHLKEHDEDVCYGVVTPADCVAPLDTGLIRAPPSQCKGRPVSTAGGASGGGADPSRVQPKVRGLRRKPRHELARMYSQVQTTQDDHPLAERPPQVGEEDSSLSAFSRGGSHHVDVTTQQVPPRGGDVKGKSAQQPPPHDGKGNRGQQQQRRNDAGAGAWANALKYGKQPPISNPPLPSPTGIAEEIRKHTEPLRAKIASLEAQHSNPPSAPTYPSASNAESMDSEITLPKPSGHYTFESMEARLSAKMELLIGTAMAQMLGKIDLLITSKLSCRCAKLRRIADIDDDEDCTLAGLDVKTLVLPTGSGTAPLTLNAQPNHGGNPLASPIIITQSNGRGLRFRTKRVDLRLFLSTFEHLLAVVALQESGKAQTDYSYVIVSLLALRQQDPSNHILNVYCSPILQNVSFADLFSPALRVASRHPLLIVGDFNAPNRVWGYLRQQKRGRKLAELTSTLGPLCTLTLSTQLGLATP